MTSNAVATPAFEIKNLMVSIKGKKLDTAVIRPTCVSFWDMGNVLFSFADQTASTYNPRR